MKPSNLLTVTLLASLTVLSGCVSHSSVSEPAPASSLTQQQPISGPSRSQLLARRSTNLYRAPKHRLSFPRVVDRLQTLGYLPITKARAHIDLHGHMATVRHDAFLWGVPAPLQRAVDRYAWNASNPFIRSAVIQFERENHLLLPKGVSEGRLHPSVIRMLFSPKALKNRFHFKWVYVTKASGSNQPEQLHVWEHGRAFVPSGFASMVRGFAVLNGWVWGTVVNTGVLGSTPDGTFPVYQRLPRTTMRGAFPIPVSWPEYRSLAGQQVSQWLGSSLMQSARGMVNGHPVRWQPYRDPGILWVNYFDAGRGLHYYPRARYGFPQSAGCVEQPYASAKVTYHVLNYGDPVTISSSVFHGNLAVIS